MNFEFENLFQKVESQFYKLIIFNDIFCNLNCVKFIFLHHQIYIPLKSNNVEQITLQFIHDLYHGNHIGTEMVFCVSL